MIKKSLIFGAICAILLLSGCSTKRQYFEPTEISKEMSYTDNLPSSIKYTSRNGATLKDGEIITKNGLSKNIKLAKNDSFIGDFEGKFIISNLDGTLKITEGDKTTYERKFSNAIISASIEGEMLGALSSNNTIYLIDMKNDNIILQYTIGDTYAQDSRVAAPVFLNSIIIYPTLDGKIMIVDKARGVIIRDAVVSSEPFFNNIIFLDIIQDKMFAATATKVMMISPDNTKYYDGQIKDVLLYQNKIFILLKDGNIEVTDLELNSLAKKEFKFAIFSNIIPSGDNLYIFEKTGYLIKTDIDLKNSEIIDLNSEIKDKSFAGKKAFYYDDKILEIR